MTQVLIDTNILVYAHDYREPDKQGRAIRVLDRLHGLASGRLSVQCLAEYFAAVRKGAKPCLTEKEAVTQVERLARSWPVLDLTALIVLEAVRGVRQHRLAYWDARIWATARLNQIPVVFSEDFQIGRVIDGVTFVNPLTHEFNLEEWD